MSRKATPSTSADVRSNSRQRCITPISILMDRESSFSARLIQGVGSDDYCCGKGEEMGEEKDKQGGRGGEMMIEKETRAS